MLPRERACCRENVCLLPRERVPAADGARLLPRERVPAACLACRSERKRERAEQATRRSLPAAWRVCFRFRLHFYLIFILVLCGM